VFCITSVFIDKLKGCNNKVIYTAQICQGCKCTFSRQFWRGKFSGYL